MPKVAAPDAVKENPALLWKHHMNTRLPAAVAKIETVGKLYASRYKYTKKEAEVAIKVLQDAVDAARDLLINRPAGAISSVGQIFDFDVPNEENED